ncbi:MAG: hypothetical protein OSA99_07430 [Acidimicrobiales bacterium]|nr:hypothetical protein [Acidimicrobiales bacterium]
MARHVSVFPRVPMMAVVVTVLCLFAAAACGSNGDEASDARDPGADRATDERSDLGGDADGADELSDGSDALPDPGVDTDSVTTCPGPVPTSLGLDPFYSQYCDVSGIPLVAHAGVDPSAMQIAAAATIEMLAHRPDVVEALADGPIRVGIIGRDQRTTEMPEWSDLYEAFPDTDWDTRARGLGATIDRPWVGAGEEDLLCLGTDPYLGESIFIHELSHTIDEFGLRVVDPMFADRLFTAFDDAIAAGLWAGTYAASSPEEYWAEGVQSYFDTNLADDFQHNHVDTRAELADHDPVLHDLVAESFGPTEWRLTCPDGSPA